VSQQCVDGGLRAHDEIDHAARQARFVKQLEELQRGQRHALGGLQDDRLAARDRVRKKPQRNHRREVEGRDRRGYPERLTDHDLVDAAGDVL